jgi:hypothetical protein
MAFAVMNVVPATPDKFPDLLAWFTSTGFEGLEAQGGFVRRVFTGPRRAPRPS